MNCIPDCLLLLIYLPIYYLGASFYMCIIVVEDKLSCNKEYTPTRLNIRSFHIIIYEYVDHFDVIDEFDLVPQGKEWQFFHLAVT